MNARTHCWVLVLLLLGLLPRRASAEEPTVARFAIVIGNNRPEGSGTETLRYADDDAVAIHQLLVEAGVDSVLLAALDKDTAELHPLLRPDGSPRRDELERALAALSVRMKEESKRGLTTELLFFFSGHGDREPDEGAEGYLVFEDGRLSRADLTSLLKRSPATYNHVFVDACKSHFLAFDKGPGGSREPYLASTETMLPGEFGNAGFVLSTSSNGDSHEWERFQRGILSYEVQSALRGAADANGDDRVTYAELGAFLENANQRIPNAKYRPDFGVHPPGGDKKENLNREVFRWKDDRSVVELDGGLGHVYIENARGERLLDAHPAPGQKLKLHVPSERPLFVVQDDEQAEHVVDTLGPVSVTSLEPARPKIARRGALHLAFQKLFGAPFAEQDVANFEDNYETATRTRESMPARRHWMLGLGAWALYAYAPEPALGGAAFLEHTPTETGWLAPELRLAAAFATTAEHWGNEDGLGARWSWATLRLQACPVRVGTQRITLHACAAFEAGDIISKGQELSHRIARHALWLAPGAEVRVAWWSVGGVELELGVAGTVPLTRPHYYFDYRAGDWPARVPIPDPPVIGGALTLGAGYMFP